MKILKEYVRNRARPEGCIAECYLAEECISFCNSFIDHPIQVDSLGHNQNVTNEGNTEGRPLGSGTSIMLSDEMLECAHRYVLFNTAIVEPFLE